MHHVPIVQKQRPVHFEVPSSFICDHMIPEWVDQMHATSFQQGLTHSTTYVVLDWSLLLDTGNINDCGLGLSRNQHSVILTPISQILIILAIHILKVSITELSCGSLLIDEFLNEMRTVNMGRADCITRWFDCFNHLPQCLCKLHNCVISYYHTCLYLHSRDLSACCGQPCL